jgi:hypothetical protein
VVCALRGLPELSVSALNQTERFARARRSVSAFSMAACRARARRSAASPRTHGAPSAEWPREESNLRAQIRSSAPNLLRRRRLDLEGRRRDGGVAAPLPRGNAQATAAPPSRTSAIRARRTGGRAGAAVRQLAGGILGHPKSLVSETPVSTSGTVRVWTVLLRTLCT